MSVAENTRAFPKVALFVLVELQRESGRHQIAKISESSHHLRQTSRGDNVARVNKAVEMAGRLFDCFAHVVFTVKVEDVCDEIESILVVLNLGVETSEIETVCQVLLVDLAEVLVSTGRNELVGIVVLAV